MKKVVTLILFFISSYVFSTTFLTEQVLKNNRLILNGVGTRKATWFKVEVYDAALYLAKKTKDPKEIISGDQKIILMKFKRSVSKNKMSSTWMNGFKRLGLDKKLNNQIKTFSTFFSDLKEDDIVQINFDKEKTQVFINNVIKGVISNVDFTKGLISLWFVKPEDKGLAKQLRGL